MKIPNPQVPNPSWNGVSDPHKFFLFFILIIVFFLLFLGDQVCFKRGAEGFVETLIAYPTSWGYLIFCDRFFAALFAGIFWLLSVGSFLFFIFVQWERRWIEPMMAKRAVEQIEREKKWMNKYGKDLF